MKIPNLTKAERRSQIYSMIVLACLLIITSCRAREEMRAQHDSGADGVAAFIDNLRTVHCHVMKEVIDGWPKHDSLPLLLDMLKGQEPCGYVALEDSSRLYTKRSTVAHEAAYLIYGVMKGKYPPMLDSLSMTDEEKSICIEWGKNMAAGTIPGDYSGGSSGDANRKNTLQDQPTDDDPAPGAPTPEKGD